MSQDLRLELLGHHRILLAGSPLNGLVSAKAIGLLAYLSVTRTVHTRESLAGLLWSRSTERSARASLRMVLSNLRQSVGQDFFETNRKTVSLTRTSDLWLDVAEFERLTGIQSDDIEESVTAWRQAIALYRGDFLEGITVNNAPEFEEWLLVRREYLRKLAVRTLDNLIRYSIDTGDFADGIDQLSRLLTLDPWREDAHRELMRLLALSGRRSAAIRQYERCRETLSHDLGVELEAETTQLYESILSGEIQRQSSTNKLDTPWLPLSETVSTKPLPGERTSFIGRERELRQITSMLNNPSCRLLTLVGPGGIGKSRLALQVARDRRVKFRDGTAIVPLASLSSSRLICVSIATAIGVDVGDSEVGISQLVSVLKNKSMLIVLDNFEHLIDSAPLLNEILDGAPNVKLLVTSRERLALSAEWLMMIAGLPVPDQHHAPDLTDWSAVQLFVERARQTQPTFELTTETAMNVIHICSLLNGMPLGIELAAAWVRIHSIADIETKIRDNLDFLSSTLRDLPERHQSLKAVYLHSYALLNKRTQAILQALSVFRGGFLLSTAEAVVGATANDLLLLVDKSLVSREESGRYTMHEIVRQYAYAELQTSPVAEEALRRHATFFADLLESAEGALKRPNGTAVRRAIQAEIDNIRAAWQWASEHREYNLLNRALDGLQLYFEISGWIGEGLEMLDIANVPKPPESAPLLPHEQAQVTLCARIIGWRARFFRVTGRHHVAQELIAEAASLRDQHDMTFSIAYELDTRARIANAFGSRDEASQLQRQALANAERSDDLLGMAFAYRGHGGVAYDTGHFVEARRWFRKAMRARRELGDWVGVAYELHRLGEVDRRLGNYYAARQHKEEALAIFRERGDAYQLHFLLRGISEVAQDAGQLEEAEAILHEARAAVDRFRVERPSALVEIDRVLAFQSFLTGDLTRAYEQAEETLRTARNNGLLLSVLRNLQLLALIKEAEQDWPAAWTYALQAVQHGQAADKGFHENRARAILGRVAIGLGNLEEAAELFQLAFARLTEIKSRPAILDVVSGLAALHAAQAALSTKDEQLANANLVQATELLTLILRDPAIWFETRQRADALRSRVASCLDEGQFTAAERRGRQRQLSNSTFAAEYT